LTLGSALAQEASKSENFIRENYTKREVQIPVRDGVKLFTSIYSPKDTSKPYPMLMTRTPYSCSPYGEDNYPNHLGLNYLLEKEKYIYVFQDVRGRFMSEGEFDNMRPHVDKKSSSQEIDESSDTYDTIEYLVKNVPNNNGRLGIWGISYPGFYSSAGMIDAHPALKAVSPQAPIADWWFDDFHHHGAFFLPHAFNFLSVFGQPRPKPTTQWGKEFDHGTPDGYQFFLDIGPLKNANERYFKNNIAYWNTMCEHPNYDEYWQKRNLLPHLHNVAPAVMTVGGWFDAEDLYGACKTYRAVEKQNPGVFNSIVMGPWRHGGWSRDEGESLGFVNFGSKTAEYYQKEIEANFFEHFLKDKGKFNLPKASMFETGANRWQKFDQWPPANLRKESLYFRAGNELAFEQPSEGNDAHDEYVSDPQKPVPFTEAISVNMTVEYMTDDQRFAARRPDVVFYQTDVLHDDITLAGELLADLWVSTSGTDSDWVVKLIDVFPPNAPDSPQMKQEPQQTRQANSGGRRRRRFHEEHMGGYQMMVRSEVIRGRFRNSDEKPEPFVANEPTHVALELQDVLHTFKKGHRIMVQVQSTWFPLVDRNPQKYVDNIYLNAQEKDFIKATQRVFRSREHPSSLKVGILPAGNG
jgi:putative CocE/NonD family hydrolase